MIEVSGVRIKKGNKILLLHRKKWNHWELPGGTVEPNEDPRETAIREAKEEIGVDVEILKELKPVEFEINKKQVKSYQYIAKIIFGVPRIAEPHNFDDMKYLDIKKEKNIAPNLK